MACRLKSGLYLFYPSGMKIPQIVDEIYQLLAFIKIRASGSEDQKILDDDIANLGRYYAYLTELSGAGLSNDIELTKMKRILSGYRGLTLPAHRIQIFKSAASE